MIASEIFKDKKDNYPQSVPKLFVSTRLSKTFFPLLQISCETSPGYVKDFNSMSPLIQMERTSTPRWCRLWAATR